MRLLGLGLAALLVLTGCTDAPSVGGRPDPGNGRDAQAACRDYVSDLAHLKRPRWTAAAESHDGMYWTAYLEVRANRSAKPVEYLCSLRYIGGESYDLLALQRL